MKCERNISFELAYIKSFSSTIFVAMVLSFQFVSIFIVNYLNLERNEQKLIIIWMLNNENEQFMCLQWAHSNNCWCHIES